MHPPGPKQGGPTPPRAPTPEQAAIADAVLLEGASVVVNAVAGSGKTTTVLDLAARAAPLGLRVLQVTYNSALKAEVRQKAADAGLDNMTVHTYHSLARAHYDADTTNDSGVERSLGMPPREPLAFDVMVFDECQDMTLLLLRLARKAAADAESASGRAPRLLLLGDRLQTVYAFKGADPRFLTLAPRLWPPREFRFMELSTSFRLTANIARFVTTNLAAADGGRISAPRAGPPVDYVVAPRAEYARVVVSRILALFDEGLRPWDVFVLAPSVRQACHQFIAVENALVMRGIPVHVPNMDERTLDDDVMRNKVVFSTFHQSKGRERPAAIILGVDGDYCGVYARGEDPSLCPSPVFVACTRASRRLLLVQQAERGPAPFVVGLLHGGDHVRVSGDPLQPQEPEPEEREPPSRARAPPRTVPATSLVRHISDSARRRLEPLVEAAVRRERGPSEPPPKGAIPSKVRTGVSTYEDVSEINAYALAAMFERATGLRETSMHARMREHRSRAGPFLRDNIDGALAAFEHAEACGGARPAQFLRLANVFRAIETRQLFKLRQIQRFDWISPAQADAVLAEYAREVLEPERAARGECEFERPVAALAPGVALGGEHVRALTVSGRLDVLTATRAIEVKCTQALVMEHFLQVLLYRWMWDATSAALFGPREFRLANVLTGETWSVCATPDIAETVARELLADKAGEPAQRQGDDAFVAACA